MIIFCHCWEIENKLIAKYQSNHESDDMVKIQKLQQTDRGTRLKPHLPVWTELTWISFTFILKDDGIQFYKIIRCIGGSRGARPARAPLRVPILSFWHTKFSKRNHLGSPHSLLRGPHPPYGKSWIHHWDWRQLMHNCFWLIW